MKNYLLPFLFITCINCSCNSQYKINCNCIVDLGWKINYSHKEGFFLSYKYLSELTFTKDEDTSTRVKYLIFNNSIVDNEFKSKLNKYLYIQSCMQITNGKADFLSFEKRGYYYFLIPCNYCSVGLDSSCAKLSECLNSCIKQPNIKKE